MILQPIVHFYVMWFGLGGALGCFFSSGFCKVFEPKPLKLVVFLLLLFSAFSWVSDLTTMNNMPAFSADTEAKLYKKKHEFSELQRDVYMQFIEMCALFSILLVPYLRESYEARIRALERQIGFEREQGAEKKYS